MTHTTAHLHTITLGDIGEPEETEEWEIEPLTIPQPIKTPAPA